MANELKYGETRILKYPEAWGKDPCYGWVSHINDDGTYYLSEAQTGQLMLINPENLLIHGATCEPLRNAAQIKHYNRLKTKSTLEARKLKDKQKLKDK